MFKLNSRMKMTSENFMGSIIYTIDDFYADPYEIVSMMKSNEPNLYKMDQYPTFNSVHFEDRRHRLEFDQISENYRFLSIITGQALKVNTHLFTSNFIKFRESPFNNHRDHWWWPHRDRGYNCVVYFNEQDDLNGTNIYESDDPLYQSPRPEHLHPWVSRDKLKRLKILRPAFNRMIIFDGLKFIHGMSVEDDRYFGDEFRMNQVYFFQ